MKTLPKRVLLIITILFILTSCEKENEINKHQLINQNGFIINEFLFNDLASNLIFQKGFEKLNYKLKNYSKSDIDNFYNFIIDSTRIKEVIKDEYTTYTLLIKRPFKTPEYFENLVIEKRENENIAAYIIKYTLASQIKLFDEHHTFSFDASTSVTPLDLDNLSSASKSSRDCRAIAQTWCNWDHPHVAGPA
jgi:hypothetical protein